MNDKSLIGSDGVMISFDHTMPDLGLPEKGLIDCQHKNWSRCVE